MSGHKRMMTIGLYLLSATSVILTELLSKGVDAEGVVRHGHPAEALSSLADELNATNIIIGRKGQSPLKTKLFGSVASTLVQISAHPVTVVP